MARPKKVVIETTENKETTNTKCFGCNKPFGERGAICSKGDRNQYGFCSIECFNKDKTE